MLILNHIGHSYFNYFDGDVDHIRKLLETNFLSYVAMTVTALPMLKESEGNIVVVSSVAGGHMRGQALRASLSLPPSACCRDKGREAEPPQQEPSVSSWLTSWMHDTSALGFYSPCPQRSGITQSAT